MPDDMTKPDPKLLPKDSRDDEQPGFGKRLAHRLGGLGGPFGGSILGSILGSFKRGGDVKKTGAYRLHKGERVVPASRVKSSGRSRGGR